MGVYGPEKVSGVFEKRTPGHVVSS